MNPQHKNPTRKDRTATAPYNFVPLPEEVLPAVAHPNALPDHNNYGDDTYKHTGYFKVKLTTLSPLYIRSGLNPQQYEQAEREQKNPPNDFRKAMRNQPDFFHTGDSNKPVIPGSSLRGMLRQLVEIITYSKVKDVPAAKLVYRAVGDPSAIGIRYRDQMLGRNKSPHSGEMRFDYSSPRVKGGYLEKDGDGWAIRPAKEELGESIIRVHYDKSASVLGNNGPWHNVFLKPAARTDPYRGQRNNNDLYLNVAETPEVSATSGPGLVPATLVESGDMGGDHPKHWHCAIYEADPDARLIPIPDALWGIYIGDRDMTRDKNRPTLKLRQAGNPLFYLVDDKGQLIYFGSTVMFRLVYDKRPIDLIPPALRDPAVIDFAEALFGYVRSDEELNALKPRPKQGEKGRAYAGRVLVTNAELNPGQSDIWLPADEQDGTLVPRILASPKPTSFQHYLTQHAPDNKTELDHYDSPNTVLRGHKMYWAKGDLTADELRAKHPDEDRTVPQQAKSQFYFDNDLRRWRVKDSSKQHTRLRPVRSGKTFTFRIYFDCLSAVELGALEWALRLPGPARPYCHRLGMGKPLGMGAVSLEPTLHLIKPMDRYGKLLVGGDSWALGHDEIASSAGYTSHFEEHVLSRLPEAVRAPTLTGVERIQMLLTMLEWRNPERNRDVKQYMTNLQDFKARLVLPDPLHIEAAARGGQEPQQGRAHQGGRRQGDRGDRRNEPTDSSQSRTFDKPRPQRQKEITQRESTEETRSFADEFMEQLRKRQGGEEPKE